jgi:hypothetical protein
MSKIEFKPIGTMVLIRPLKIRYKTQKQFVPKTATPIGEVNDDEKVEPTTVKAVKTKIKMNQQLAEVISIGTLDPEKTPYKAEDIIAYDYNSVREFDLISGTFLIAAHNILGIVTLD